MIKGIIQVLVESDQIITMVGANNTGRVKVFPIVCPQAEDAPYITIFETSKPPIKCKEGKAGYKFTCNIVCYGKDYETIDRIADAVESILDNQKGIFAGINYKHINYDTRSDGYDNDAQLYLKIITISGVI